MERAGSALGPLVKDLGLEDALRLYRIKEAWKEALGEPLALHTAPTSLKRGLLHVNADTPAWLQQAGYFREKIVERLRRFEVSDIRMKLGRVSPERPRRRAREEVPFAEPDPAFIESLLSPIHDEELREGVRRAARKGLGRKRKSRS
ncbi:MAG: DUF721 domain-containing protein [Nitrospirota bacterium]